MMTANAGNFSGQAEIMPDPGEKVEFENWNRKFQSDVTGYLDFETVQVNDPDKPDVKTLKAYQYSLIFVDKFNKLIFEHRDFCPQGKAGELCLEKLLEIENQVFSHARRCKNMTFSRNDMRKAQLTNTCHICEKKFERGEKKVKDHCHYSSKFLG